MSHAWLMRFLEHRIGDRCMLRLIGRARTSTWPRRGLTRGLHRMVTDRPGSMRQIDVLTPETLHRTRGRGFVSPRHPQVRIDGY
jgi:hypothetical protein